MKTDYAWERILNKIDDLEGVKMNIKPLENRIIVKPLEAEVKTPGGIVIPENAKEKPQKGEIVAVGDGKIADSGQKIEMTLKVGDKVLYGKYSGTDVAIDGSDYLIMKESDVLAIICDNLAQIDITEIEPIYRVECPYCKKLFEFEESDYDFVECEHCDKEIMIV